MTYMYSLGIMNICVLLYVKFKKNGNSISYFPEIRSNVIDIAQYPKSKKLACSRQCHIP